MITEAKIDFARYDKTLYDKSDFDCGDSFLNEYILKYAGQLTEKTYNNSLCMLFARS